MRTEILNTGSELMLGRVLNTHQQWLCRELTDLGYLVARQVAVPDTGPDILQAVREALARADLIIVTGGLGPTSDDLTRDLIADLLGTTLVEDPIVLADIERFFATRKRRMPVRTRVQAMVPKGAIVFRNPNGTAPGLALKVSPNPFRPGSSSWLILLPGPPRELRPMFTDSAVPLVRKEFPAVEPFVCRTVRTTGLGESLVEERVAGPLAPLVTQGLQIGYCARPGEVDVRVSASGNEAEALVSKAETIIKEKVERYGYGSEGEELETVLVRSLTESGQTLVIAESCTGGLISHRITNVPGASRILLAGFVTYSNSSKEQCLGVSAQTLSEHGAVSAEVAREMAEGARQRCQSTYTIAVTGIAGPSGGTDAKPVGTVFIAVAGPFETIVERQLNQLDRETFKSVTSQQALNLLRNHLVRSQAGAAAGQQKTRGV